MPTATVQRTPLFEEHLRLHAQMTSFGGWSMPLQYSSIREEHQAVRGAVGIFDLSHMGEIRIDGAAAPSALERLVSRRIGGLKPGRVQYALLCNEQGGILDDLLVYVDEAGYLLVVNASNQESDFAWIHERSGEADVSNVGSQTALLGVQGPRAFDLVQSLAAGDLEKLRYYRFAQGAVAGVECLISRTGYTGEDGFELFCRNQHAVSLWRRLLDEGKTVGIKPCGLGARDTLRLEAGMRLYGNDMDRSTNPVEAGLDWAVDLDKDFIGAEVIRRVKERGVNRTFVGLRMLDRNIPRHGYRVMHEGAPVGLVASGNVSFTLGYNIGTAYLRPDLAEPGTSVDIEVRGTRAPAEVVALPFYSRKKQSA